MKRGQFERFVFPPTPDLTAGFFYKKKNSGNTDRIKLVISEKTLIEWLDRKWEQKANELHKKGDTPSFHHSHFFVNSIRKI